jgi:hypothetical protein
MATSLIYTNFRPSSAQGIAENVAGFWSVGVLFLYTSLGGSLSLTSLNQGIKYLPVLLVGLAARFVSIFLIAFVIPLNATRTVFLRGPFTNRRTLLEATFCFVSSLPRGTIQVCLIVQVF